MDDRRTNVLILLTSVVVCGMTFSSIVSQKIVSIGPLSVSIASIWFSLFTFPATDIICNEFGKKKARFAVVVGWFAMILTTALATISSSLPPIESFQQHEPTFDYLMSSSSKVLLVGTFSYLIAQLLDVQIFSYIKKVTKGRWLFFRNNVSTAISQTVNTAIIVIGLFWSLYPTNILFDIFLSTLVIKLAIALLDTFVVYAGVFATRKYCGTNTKTMK